MFHFFVAWEPEFEEESVQAHRKIVEAKEEYRTFSEKHAWWGKFRWEMADGQEIDLEKSWLGETYDKDAETASRKAAQANEFIGTGEPVYLYVYNPVPSRSSLYVANVRQVVYTAGKALTENPNWGKDKSGRPACAHLPEYYFLRKKIHRCQDCRQPNRDCKLRIRCNFYFNIDKIVKDPIAEEVHNLVYAHQYEGWGGDEGENLRLAVPNSYPILVTQKDPVDFFDAHDPLLGIPQRPDLWGPPQVVVEKGNRGKFGPKFNTFLHRLWHGVKFIKKIGLRSREDSQRPHFEPGKTVYEIEGGYPGRPVNVGITLYTTCKTQKQQERLVEHLTNSLLK
jgi:hypothetical protein